jgi:putative flippase GtrA
MNIRAAVRSLRQRNGFVRFVRFLVVGTLNTAFAYAVYALLIYVTGSYMVAVTLTFIIAPVVGFKSHRKFVFNNAGTKHALLLYLASWGLLYLANVTSLRALVNAGIDSYIAGALLMPPMAVLSFVVLRFVVFRHGKPVQHE